MGTSKSYRGGPGWEPRNTPGKATKPSKGSKSTAEGTHMSGGQSGRTGMKNTARKKSKSGGMSAKNPGPHGYS